MAKSIARNAAFMTMASVLQKIISFAYFTFIVRHFAPSAVGKYSTALAFTTIFAVLVDIGLTNVFIRDGAKDESQVQTLLSRVLGLKVGLAIIAYSCIILVSRYILHYDTETQLLIVISGITVIFDSLQVTLYGVLRIFGQLKFEAIGLVLAQTMTLLGGGIFLYLNLPIMYLMLAFLLTSILHVSYVTLVVGGLYHIYPRLVWHWQQAGNLVKTAIPFALAAIFFRIFTATDSLMVFSKLGPEAAGWYSIPTKIMSAFQFIPLSLVAAIYPRLSEWSVHDTLRQSDAFAKSMQYLMLIVFPVSIGILVLAPGIIPHFFSAKYLPAIVPLQCLMVCMIFSFLMYPIGACLNAMGKQHIHTAFVGGVMLFNIVITWFAVGQFGMIGGACASLASTALLAGLEYWYLSSKMAIPHRTIGIFGIKILIGTVLMGVIVSVAGTRLPLLVLPFLGAMCFVSALYLFQVFSWNDVRLVVNRLRAS